MRYFVVLSLFCLILVTIKANSYLDSDLLNDDELNYPAPDNYLDDLQAPAEKRACIRRSGNCDHRPNGCCYNSSCRCNLWGSNCRCQRMGLFQKWGK
ncbi:CLUMA_CG017701, isoform A [Clunio marinus]|uniref:CLUMA_CG017701, isoform A n=1 Tax=Clunio marinus TaxID=568069 RepID=A0A1J1IWH2_9DIPT|nr:CLUMA_CG017701, isoform A [Clunio marinus]